MGYSYVGVDRDWLPSGDAKYSINAIASGLFWADLANPAALMLTWAGFGVMT